MSGWAGLAGLLLAVAGAQKQLPQTPRTPPSSFRPAAAEHAAPFDHVFNGTVNRGTERLYSFNYTSKVGQVDALRVTVKSDSEDDQYPVLFVVRQQKGVLSWQLPLIFHGLYQRSYNYTEVSRTLCPSESVPENRSSEQIIFINVASMAPYNAHYQLQVTKIKNFQLSMDATFAFTASPSQPQYFLYQFPPDVDSVIVRVISKAIYPCSVVSIQDIVCPVYDLDYNVEFNGVYQSMTKQAALTVQKKDFPSKQFFVVFVIKPEDYTCGGSRPLSIQGKANYTWNRQRMKHLEVTVLPSVKGTVYMHAILFSFLTFFSFYLGALVVGFVQYIRFQRKTSIRGLNDGLGTMNSSHPITANTPEGSSYGAIDESSSSGGQELSNLDRRPPCGSDTDSSVEEESDFDTMPEIESNKNVIRTKMFLYLSDLSRKDRRIVSKKYKIYFWNIITIAVFYALPVIQLVITYQTVVNVTGNQDICYYNFLCAHPLGVLSAFNNILSNIGHMLLGVLFLLIVLCRDLLHRRSLEMKDICAMEYGIPKHFGLFYAMGVALMMEGVLSACYHVCPNYTNFQFDTSFMYMIAGLCMLKLYQTRHPDINASAYSAYASFAVIICLAVLGVLTGTLIISMSVSYLGHFQYGYTLLLVHHPASLFVANLTKEEVSYLEHFWFTLSPAVIFFPVGGFTGIALFANVVDKYGRKSLLLFNNTLAFVASIFLCISNSIHLFEFTAFVNFMIGISAGIFSCCDPLYLLEVSPTPIRGSTTATLALFFSLGVILAYMLGLPHLLGNAEGFPFMAVLLGFIATICILLLLICPESPRFIFIQKKNETKATEVLRSLRAQGDVMNDIKDLQKEDFYEVMANEKKMTLWKFLHGQNFRWPIVTTIVLMVGSQLSGINAMLFYTKRVYAVMGLSTPISEIISLSMNLIIIITIVASINLIETWGRRIPLIMGFMICSMSCILLTFALEFQEQSPLVSCLSLVFIIIFLIGHMIGPGPMRLVILGELFLQSTRALAFTIGYSALWFSRFISGMILIQLELLLGPYSLLVYWPFCVATFIYLFKMLPESKGKTFVEIQLAQKEEKGN